MIEIEHSSGNVFKDLGFDDAEAQSLHLRGLLAIEIEKLIAERGWNQTEAAERMGVSRPRLNDVLRGRLQRVTIDRLVNMLAAVGQHVRLSVHDAA